MSRHDDSNTDLSRLHIVAANPFHEFLSLLSHGRDGGFAGCSHKRSIDNTAKPLEHSMTTATTTLSRNVSVTFFRTLASTLRERWQRRKATVHLRKLNRHQLNDVGVAELPNGTFVKLELNRGSNHG